MRPKFRAYICMKYSKLESFKMLRLDKIYIFFVSHYALRDKYYRFSQIYIKKSIASIIAKYQKEILSTANNS